MKMPDGGFRPAYNVQFASLPGSGIVVGAQVTTVGSDRGLAEPMARKIAAAFGRRPARHLLDGGYQAAPGIEAAHAAGTRIYSPPLRSKSGKDPHLPRHDDGPGVAAWRQRMATPGRRRSTSAVRVASSSTPSRAISTSIACSCAAASRSRPG